MLKSIRGLLEYQPTMEEKTLVWERMIGFRGHDRGSALIGTSSRNQRIERLWRDVFRCFGDVFYYTFKSMEESGLLDITNPLHCLFFIMSTCPELMLPLIVLSRPGISTPKELKEIGVRNKSGPME